MIPSSLYELFMQTIGLIVRAFNSIGGLLGFFFVSFLRVSPLPDEVDFLLISLLAIWLVTVIIRLFRGKPM